MELVILVVLAAVVAFATPLALTFAIFPLEIIMLLILVRTTVVRRGCVVVSAPIGPVTVSVFPPLSGAFHLPSDKLIEIFHLLRQLHQWYGLWRWLNADGGSIWEDHEFFTDSIPTTKQYWFVDVSKSLRVAEILSLLSLLGLLELLGLLYYLPF